MELETMCPICDCFDNSKLVYTSNINMETFNFKVFSARRLPDRQHYQWVRCLTCGLLRSDPILKVDLTQLYMGSTFDYSAEVNGLKKTYLGLVKKVLGDSVPTRSIFEIGGGMVSSSKRQKILGLKKLLALNLVMQLFRLLAKM